MVCRSKELRVSGAKAHLRRTNSELQSSAVVCRSKELRVSGAKARLRRTNSECSQIAGSYTRLEFAGVKDGTRVVGKEEEASSSGRRRSLIYLAGGQFTGV